MFNHLASCHRPKAVQVFSLIPEGGTISCVPSEVRSKKRTMARLDRHSISNAVLALPDDLIHYRHDRIPTVREMARLQTFDDDYVFWGKRTSGFVERRVDVPQYTQVGNAVPPLLGYALGTSLLASLGGERKDLRGIARRRARHLWVRGSSAYAGYILHPDAMQEISLLTVEGKQLPLSVSEDDISVPDAVAVQEWGKRENRNRGQWAPNVLPRNSPAHMAEKE